MIKIKELTISNVKERQKFSQKCFAGRTIKIKGKLTGIFWRINLFEVGEHYSEYILRDFVTRYNKFKIIETMVIVDGFVYFYVKEFIIIGSNFWAYCDVSYFDKDLSYYDVKVLDSFSTVRGYTIDGIILTNNLSTI